MGVGVGVSCGRRGGFLWLRVKQVLFLQLSVPEWRKAEASPPPNPPEPSGPFSLLLRRRVSPENHVL